MIITTTLPIPVPLPEVIVVHLIQLPTMVPTKIIEVGIKVIINNTIMTIITINLKILMVIHFIEIINRKIGMSRIAKVIRIIINKINKLIILRRRHHE